MTPSSRDERDIRQTIDRYAAGLRRGHVKTLKQVFRPEAIVSGYIEKELFVEPVRFLYDYVRKNDSPAKRKDPFQCKVRSVKISGRTAAAKVAERAYLGFDYETSLQLLKIDRKWWIVSKLFSGTAVVSFANDILPRFHPMDIQCMRGRKVFLADFKYMRRSAPLVLMYLNGTAEPRMPYGGPYWKADALKLFQRWIDGGLKP